MRKHLRLGASGQHDDASLLVRDEELAVGRDRRSIGSIAAGAATTYFNADRPHQGRGNRPTQRELRQARRCKEVSPITLRELMRELPRFAQFWARGAVSPCA